MAASTRCLHGLDSRFCALCNRRPSSQQSARPAASSRRRLPSAPSLSQWKAYCAQQEAARLAAITAHSNIHICILCLTPMSWLDATEPATRWSGLRGGTRTDPGDRRIVSRLSPASIRVGCRVKVWEHVDVGTEEPELVAKLVPMTLTGLGCPACRDEMFRETTAALGDYADENAQFNQNMASPGLRAAVIRSSRTPSRRTPYIDITERVSRMKVQPPAGGKHLGREPRAATKPGMTALERYAAMRARTGTTGMTSKLISIAVFLLWLAQPAAAQPAAGFDWPAFTAYVGGLTADGITTARAMTNGSGCVEGNLALSATPSNSELARYIAPQVAVGALIGWLAQKAQNRPDSTPGQRRFVKWFARGFLWGRGAMGYEAAVHNIRLCGW